MNEYQVIIAIVTGISVLLFLIIRVKLNPFIALLISSIAVGLIAGLETDQIIKTISTGMGNTLGYVAVVVGLGAIFGSLLENSGAAYGLAQWLIKTFGDKNARVAVLIAGFVIAIPVFFDVAFIILIPVLHALSTRTSKSIITYALPLLAGLAITHSLIPPTPGPVAVADIIGVDLGYVIGFGVFAGIPVAIAGLAFSRLMETKVKLSAYHSEEISEESDTNISLVLFIIALPILLIFASTVSKAYFEESSSIVNVITFVGHPFVALTIAVLLALYFLGIRKGDSAKDLLQITNKSLAPAGSIILITGAGGVFKQVLIETGAGDMIASAFTGGSEYILFLGFGLAALLRIVQGSATVAMITSAGVVAPILSSTDITDPKKALVVLAIACGSIFLSHVNDSGFWLVNRYLNLSVTDTFKTWTLLTVVIGSTGFLILLLFYQFF